MATGKRYYWIKLKESFMSSDTVDFLMGQKDGANYVVLYQMLCLKTLKTDGKLERQLGEIIVPYDEAKIQRDTKYFSIDTIRIALKLYQSLGLIYTDENGTLVLSGYKDLIGSETDYASQKRRQIEGKKESADLPGMENLHSNFHSDDVEILHTDIDIEKDIDIEIDKEKEINNNSIPKKGGVFQRFAGSDKELAKALKEYNEYRNKKKKPLTDEAKERFCKKLEKFPREQWIDLIRQTIDKGWTDIYELDKPKAEGRNAPVSKDPAKWTGDSKFNAAIAELMGNS